MSLVVSEKSSSFTPIPEDTYPAVCVAMYDIGEQHDKTFDKIQKKVILVWELMGITYTDGETGEERNRTISRTFTQGLHKKSTLRALLKSWRGREFTPDELKNFDLKNVLGVPCQLQVIHDKRGENTYANVGAVTKLMKGIPAPVPQSEPVYFDLDVAATEDIDELPEWIKKRVKESITYKVRFGESTLRDLPADDPDSEEDLPF